MFTNIEKRAIKYFHEALAMFSLPAAGKKELTYMQEPNWRFTFRLHKKFLSKIYKMVIGYQFPSNSIKINDVLRWNYRKKKWQGKHRLCDALNENRKLKQMIQQVDLESLELKQVDGNWVITAIPIPGSYLFTLLPPVQYFVKLKQEEVQLLKQILALVEHTTVEWQMKQSA
ncbi:DUF3156 family protein [Gracilibacillus caseinilyticus]|uniref:DUF3156 family protein n=1 Tax=Gracilibacillus caseinilyticus TaxID=2932256 RepID=A0ABY4EQB2_9BACI|nr:DUF3156 family protein [Gracilibacillus caseinilyticus]UOQ46627.1 DUF3156 family protein [Gracilibacillus caseinilyticus]